MNKKILIISGSILFVILFATFLIYSDYSSTGNSISTQQVEIVPLNPEQRNLVIQTITSSDFIEDIPKKDPIAITFYDFENGQRRWRDGFLMGKNGLLSQGEPSVYLALHSKYISELNGNNLCDVIKRANSNGDLTFQSDYGNVKLLLKYAGMLKHRDCFGF